MILHTSSDLESIHERGLHENFSLSKTERMKKAFQLMAISSILKSRKRNKKKRLFIGASILFILFVKHMK